MPDPNHRFVRWTAGSSNVEVSQEASCTFTASRDSALTAHFVRTYKIATAVAAGGGGGVTGAGTYDEGAMVTLTATPNLHYRFDKWTTGLEETTVSTESPHTFTANSDMTLVAHFVEAYNITAVAFPLAGGSITGTGPFDAGAAVTLTAVANTGYRFDKWTLTATGAEVSTANPFAFTLDRDTSLTARFIKTHTIAAQAVPSAGGTITYSPETNDGIYDTGTEVTLTAVPNAGYRFVDWTETGGSATSDPARVVVADKDRTLEANFMATYTITAVVEIGGTVTGEAPYNPATNSGIYDHGADVSLIATADHNYKFISWIDADADTLVSTANPYTFQAGGNINLKAHFAAIYTITVVPGAGGNAWGGGTFTAGSSATVTAVPNDGYHFVDWTEDEVPVHSDPSYTFTVSQSRTLTANFEQDQSQYAVTYNQPANGTLTVTAGSASVASGALVDAGADIVITATPAAGYELATLTVNGQPFASGGTHTVNETTTIACSFELIPVAQHTVTYDTPDNGTLTVMAGSSAVASGASVDTGTDIVITATPAADYELATLTVNGQPFTNGGTHTVNGATTIACSFELISVAQHTVTYTTPENGTLTVMAGSNAVASGTSVDTGTDIVITATPAADYELAMLTVNGQPFTNGGTHTVNGATTIACSFELISAAQHTVTYATPDNGTLTVMAGSNAVASGASVDTGTDIVITATPDAGYQLATLTVNGQPFVSGETHTVNEASTIVCSFEEKPNITELLINNIPVGEISDTMTYDVACGDTDVILGITANGNIAISVGSTDYSNNPTIPLSKDKVTISIGITAGTATTSFALDVIKPLGSAATPMYVERWGSPLAIVNNPANNGGHTFDDYRWYLNGAAMEGSNGGYILLNGRPATAYSAEVHSLTTDVWHKLCDDRAATPQAHIVAYPNPVKAGQTLYLNLPDGVDKVTVRLYDMNGNLKKQQSGVQQAVSMPNQHGIYLMQVQLPNGNVETQRIIVE